MIRGAKRPRKAPLRAYTQTKVEGREVSFGQSPSPCPGGSARDSLGINESETFPGDRREAGDEQRTN